ncbi:MAG TPA: hypothetical protein GXZ92_02425 [Clostridiales bacterium]|nr:hypothetical protein [Clostridiales bacterium]
MYDRLIEELNAAADIAVFVHINPDGDSVGSSLALYNFLKKKNKTVHLYSPNADGSIPAKFSYLKNYNAYNAERLTDKQYDCAVALDCGDASRLSEDNFKIFKKAKTKIVIDHHESHENFASITVCEPQASSTTQILYKILKEFDKSAIDKDIALALYTGLVTDSGSFSYSSTSPETHIVASELLAYGIDAGFVSRKVMKDTPYALFNLKNRALSKTKFYENNNIAVINFKNDDFLATETTEADTEGIINNILDIDTVEIAISIAEINDKAFKVSFRTKGKVSAVELAKIFGGGGHAMAAGCRIYGYYDDIYNKLITTAMEMLKHA